jgi:hypothetical protein
MGNQLFQQARKFVSLAVQSEGDEQAIAKAKNALSSAYANSTRAEQEQLSEMQAELDQLQ